MVAKKKSASKKASASAKKSTGVLGHLVNKVEIVKWFKTNNPDYLRVVLKSNVGRSNYQVSNFPTKNKSLLTHGHSYNVRAYKRDGKTITSNAIMFGSGVTKFVKAKETSVLKE